MSLSESGYCLVCDICVAVIVRHSFVLCMTSVLLSLSGTVLCCVVCDVCVAVIVRHNDCCCV